MSNTNKNHPEETCQTCGCKNPIWYADNELFNNVNGSSNGIICPSCFEYKANEKGINIIFKAVAYPEVKDDKQKGMDKLVKDYFLNNYANHVSVETTQPLESDLPLPCCGVPADVHGTCCGWQNATIRVDANGVITDKRHPHFGLNFNDRNIVYKDF
jgi:hypothetical protein